MDQLSVMFPGVGSQYSGMAQSFYENFPAARKTFEEASEITGINLADLCFSEYSTEKLAAVNNAQIALLAASVATYRVFREETGLDPDYCLGHSFGEIPALCCAGYIRFADALDLVQKRSEIITRVSETIQGTMAWVVNLDTKIVEGICREQEALGKKVYVSAYDTQDQTSISGLTDHLMETARLLEQAGAIVYPLKMSGPYHSPLMADAATEIKSVLAGYTFSEGRARVIANYNAKPYADPQEIIHNLSAQLVNPIRWMDSLDYILGLGSSRFIESGPKNVLKYLVERTRSHISVLPLDNTDDLARLKEDMIFEPDAHLSILDNCLRVAVSTVNYNRDSGAYHEKVVLPFRKMEHLREELGKAGKQPTEKQLMESIQTVQAILDAKQTPEPEKSFKLSSILNGKYIKF